MSSTIVRGLCEHGPGGNAQADRKAIEEKQVLRVSLCRLEMCLFEKAMFTDPMLDMQLRCLPSLFCAILFASPCQRE